MDIFNNHIWLDYYAYAQRLFEEKPNEMWHDADKFLAIVSQAHQLLKSDVLIIPVGEFYLQALKENADTWREQKKKKMTLSIKNILAEERMLELVKVVLDGVNSLYSGKLPIVLSFPSPFQLLKQVKDILAFTDVEITEDDIDRVAMYIADLFRTFATINFTAIVLEEQSEPFSLAQLVNLLQPIRNVAEHYEWLFGLKLVEDLTTNDADFLLKENGNRATNELCKVGGGLVEAFWQDENALSNDATFDFLYGAIPANAIPEKVLEKISIIRSENSVK